MKLKLIIKRIKCEIMYRKATAAAEYASRKKGGEVFYVLPMQSGKLMVTDRKMFEQFKKAHLTDKDFKARDLFKDCVYHTLCRSKKGRQSRKRKFLRWKGMI